MGVRVNLFMHAAPDSRVDPNWPMKTSSCRLSPCAAPPSASCR